MSYLMITSEDIVMLVLLMYCIWNTLKLKQINKSNELALCSTGMYFMFNMYLAEKNVYSCV